MRSPLLFAVSSLFAVGQAQAPLQITEQVHDGGIFLTRQNVSTQPIRGYVIDIQFKDATGKSLGDIVRSAMKISKDGEPLYLLPGQSEQDHKPVPIKVDASGAPGSHGTVLDLVVFADGTTWGPGKTPQAAKLRGMIKGADAAKSLSKDKK